MAERVNIRYGSKTPREGEFVCHNFPPGWPDRPFADGGFRYWTQDPLPENFARCYCDWPVEEHYCLATRLPGAGMTGDEDDEGPS